MVVYAVRPTNKEILVDATDFKVEGLFRNNVSPEKKLVDLVHRIAVRLIIECYE